MAIAWRLPWQSSRTHHHRDRVRHLELVLVTLNYRFTAQEYCNQPRDSGAAVVIYVGSITALSTSRMTYRG
jgi:hypothetical protein